MDLNVHRMFSALPYSLLNIEVVCCVGILLVNFIYIVTLLGYYKHQCSILLYLLILRKVTGYIAMQGIRKKRLKNATPLTA